LAVLVVVLQAPVQRLVVVLLLLLVVVQRLAPVSSSAQPMELRTGGS
jgi:hypothetical protein